MKGKLRFYWNSELEHWDVKAKRLATGKWEVIGFCHARAKPILQRGERVNELLRLTIKE